MNEMLHDELRILVSAYALDALDPGDAAELERHLDDCPGCRAALDQALETAAMLATATATVAPPPDLRERILKTARAERPTVAVEPRREIKRERRTFLGFLTPARVFATAMAMAAAVALVVAIDARRSLDDQRAADRAAIAQLRADRAAVDAAVVALVTPGARVVALSQGTAPGGAGLIVPKTGRPVLVTNLPDAPPGRIYEAWLIPAANPTPIPIGTFSGGDNRVAILTRPVTTGGTVAVTVEPGTGSKQPTTPPILAGSVS